VLLSPAARELDGRRVLVVPDGALQFVNFAALPDPGASGQPLVFGHDVVSMPSASSLAALRRAGLDRAPASQKLAVFADPVFDSKDPRIAAAARPGADARKSASLESRRDAMVRSAADAGLGRGFPRLPFTRREAQAILALVAAAERYEALDFQVTREAVLDPALSGYRYVHFATHGFFNARHPDLSGIVLSLVDREGNPKDGYLTSPDIAGLRLSADAVVLSACHTALGKQIDGEGLVGITRAFFHAGARSVVASLWTVDDVATAELMKRFYAEMLGSQRRTPSAALRAAQASMAKTRRWSAPYYWAGFLLQGDWKTPPR
jgi:CHAT domain-containing protein